VTGEAEEPTLEDRPRRYPVTRTEVGFRSGRVIEVRTDTVRLPGAESVTRDVVVHPGAVGVIAVDDAERVLLVSQYRHPAGHQLWEPPAGLLDEPGEEPLAAARRELFEETGYRAASWSVLVDAFTSPGMTDEAIRVYLARQLTAGSRPDGAAEERDMPVHWFPLAAAVEAIMAGRVHNPLAVMGVLATSAAAARGYAGLRPADADWSARDAAHAGTGQPA
jgi:8-oxo-dGTP pyrophosphatase MutT (NUDIX family)